MDDLLHLARNELLDFDDQDDYDDLDDDGQSMGTQLVRIAAAADLFHDDKRDGFATIQIADHRETWPLRSTGFKRWLHGRFYTFTGKAANASTFSDALTVIDAKAHFESEIRPVWVRTAQGDDGCIYLDLGDASWQAVRVSPNGWRVGRPAGPLHPGIDQCRIPVPATWGNGRETCAS